MNKEFEYALIPVIILQILTLLWLVIFLFYLFVKIKYRKVKLNISTKELIDKYAAASEHKNSIVYKKMLHKYKFTHKKSLIEVNEKLSDSKNILDLLIPIKIFNDVYWKNTVYNGERVILNPASILDLIKYLIIIPFIFNFTSVAILITASVVKLAVLLDLVKIFSLLSLTIFLILWFIWVYNYDKYIKELSGTIDEYFKEEEVKQIEYLLKFNYIIVAIK